MKTTPIIISLLIVSSNIILPQLKEGSFLVGGGLNGKIESFDYSTDPYDSKSENNIVEFNFFPNVGYFVVDNIAFGVAARIGLSDYEVENFTTQERIIKISQFNFTYGIGPFFRYYSLLGDFAFFFGIKYEWLWVDEDHNFDYSVSEGNRDGTILSPALGLSYFFNRYVSIESMLSYEIENIEYSGNEPNSNNYIETETDYSRFLIVVGLQVYFPVE